MIKAQTGKPRCRRFGPAGEPGSWVGKICSWLQISLACDAMRRRLAYRPAQPRLWSCGFDKVGIGEVGHVRPR